MGPPHLECFQVKMLMTHDGQQLNIKAQNIHGYDND